MLGWLTACFRRWRRRLDPPPPPYTGPVWIGIAIGKPPKPEGPDWIGKAA